MARRKKKAEAPVEYTRMSVEDLVFDDANPRVRNERNLSAIRASVKEHGQVEPVLVQRSTNRVIHGNGRLQIMKEAGYKDVDVAVLDVDDTQARKLSIVLNRSGELAGWDVGILGQHLEAMAELGDGFDPTTMGFSGMELEEILEDANALMEEMGIGEAPEDDGIQPVATHRVNGEFTPVDGLRPDAVSKTNIRLVQLFLTDDNIASFNVAVKKVAMHHNLDNVTDAVMWTVLEKAEGL